MTDLLFSMAICSNKKSGEAYIPGGRKVNRMLYGDHRIIEKDRNTPKPADLSRKQ